ncbi:uncharacterized protein STEHIDRAFT_158689 [Stereum hirsutum FP-91666 SS1]|uniref:uncharacterized protein n=1 Tax=Stereum hirsutum (strain FP-91666) TaxID=721885 RepID=UPI00044497D5|nr:uncharacterized protein STEHIDRAFT_158689 [Stereum hirsutum FP-91666 SS1]EIM84987.1 hypothetical protein STEHIDRAFT_158689 [Stereum hirsutum FP-91666 SS1]
MNAAQTLEDIKGEIVVLAQVSFKTSLSPSELHTWISKMKASASSEPGTLEFSWSRNGPESAYEFVVWERYASKEAFVAHTSSDLFKEIGAADILAKASIQSIARNAFR